MIAAALIATHGVRGIAIIVVIGVVVTLPQTRIWHAVESVLVRITGSRMRAAALVMVLVIGILAVLQLSGFFG